MKPPSILCILSMCSLHALILASLLSSPLDDYDIVVSEWDVKAFPDSEPIALNGTIEEVHSQLIKLNPNWDEDFLPKNEDQNLATRETDSTLVNRTDFWNSKYNCFGRWGRVNTITIRQGVTYLRHVSGHPRSGPSPGSCSRVSCSYYAGIYWCNEAKSNKILNSFGSMADGAEYLLSKCHLGSGIGEYTAGQVFHKTNWNVIIKEIRC